MNKEITFLLPVRIDSEERLKNLITVLNFFSQLSQVSFCILEADSDSKIPSSIYRNKNIDYLFIKDDNSIFHRTRYINIMLKRTKTEFAAIWDVDAICPVEQVRKAMDSLIINKDNTIVYPYDGKFWCCNILFSELFREKLDIAVLSDFPQNRYLMSGYYAVGGAFLVNVGNYKRYGWENENFLGWGPEDVERYKRIEMLTDTPPHRIEGDLFHLYHPRGINSGLFDEKLAYSTKKELIKVCAMSKVELHEYINTWKWLS